MTANQSDNEININNISDESIDENYSFIGKIDKKIYNCVTDDIITNEVIITKERLNHIKERHPGDFDNCLKYIAGSIENPEYIIEANKPNTAVVLKSFENGDYKTIMKIITSSDNADYKNSIITFQKVHEKEWRRLLKNKKILYKVE